MAPTFIWGFSSVPPLFHLIPPTKTRPHKPMLAEWTSEILSLSLSEVYISSPLFHLSSVIYRILSGSSSCILIFLPHLIRLGDTCSIRLHLCHLSSSSASSHPSSLILTVLSLLPQHLYLCSTDQGPEHRQGFREGLYRSSLSLTRIAKGHTCQTAHARGLKEVTH